MAINALLYPVLPLITNLITFTTFFALPDKMQYIKIMLMSAHFTIIKARNPNFSGYKKTDFDAPDTQAVRQADDVLQEQRRAKIWHFG